MILVLVIIFKKVGCVSMYRIDRVSNRITPVLARSFSDLGFSERKHLQEWLAFHPQALTTGEDDELLIIQKEFDGFDETRERLDLLAIDKEGNLVVIENKLDDSGRDVTWQALKYASYCASLSKIQIVEIYQRYLNQLSLGSSGDSPNAEVELLNFLQADDIDSIQINTLQSQRIIFVAAKYRKEVTSTVLWLSQFGIRCQCFKVTPYKEGEELFMSVDQIIPTPEASDFMIGMMAKEAEEKETSSTKKKREVICYQFWELLIEAFQKSNCSLHDSSAPNANMWLPGPSGIPGVSYSTVFAKSWVRVEIYLAHWKPQRNNYIFNALELHRLDIESKVGCSLKWDELPKKKANRISYTYPINSEDKTHWPELISWIIDFMSKLEAVVQPHLERLKPKLKNIDFDVYIEDAESGV